MIIDHTDHDQNVAPADPTTTRHLLRSLQVARIRFFSGELHAADGVYSADDLDRVVLLWPTLLT